MSEDPDPTHPFVERMAVLFDEMGHPPIAGRIFAWLLVCEPEEQTLEEIAKATGASKGSASTMTRLLTGGRMIERRLEPGSRRIRYRIRPGSWSNIVQERFRGVSRFRTVLDEALADLELAPGVEQRLTKLRDFYAFLERRIPQLVDEFEAEQGG